MNIEQARFNMVEQQIRPWNVLDQRVLDLMSNTPREEFVPDEYRTLAFSDTAIPLGNGQAMMPPKLEARMLQSLNVKSSDHALEIGTGSGYVTALLARSCRQVVSVEIDTIFSAGAKDKLGAQGIDNVSLEVGDGLNGWESSAPFDVIAITGSVHQLNSGFQHQLRIGGRLFVVCGSAPVMEAILITRISDNEWSQENLFETSITPLRGAESKPKFIL